MEERERDGALAARRRRTPQACNTCRKRKTKCDGVRPRCQHCTARGVACIWPGPALEPAALSPPNGFPDRVGPPPSVTSATPIAARLPEERALRRCYALFFDYHFTHNFCSFLFRPDLEAGLIDSPLLSMAILCLCSRYLTHDEARDYFGMASGLQVCRAYTPVARALARASSDEPSVLSIQGNLVLALSELANNEGSTHWMYAGIAIRMAQMMRLNKEYHQSHTLKEQEIRRRTFWACLLMDKLLAYFLTKPPTLATINIACALPGTDASLAYQEPTRGITLSTISAFAGFPSEIGILPYLVKTICLYGDVVDLNVCNYRFVHKEEPTDPASTFQRRHEAMSDWVEALPSSLRWSEQNYANHAGLGHGRDFVAMHMLARSAFCAAHQGYLPQLDGSSILLSAVDAAGWSLLRREPSLIATCVGSALGTAGMASWLFVSGGRARADLESVWVAVALFSAANTLLWLQYAQDAQYAESGAADKATAYFSLVLDVMGEWAGHWRAARQWMDMLRAMRAMYRAAYLGEIDEGLLAGDATGRGLASASATPPAMGAAAAASSSAAGDGGADEDSPSLGYRPRPGSGYLSLDAMPTLYDSLRFLASDTSAEPKRLHSVWMQFASGWPVDFLTTTVAAGNAAEPEVAAAGAGR